VPVSFELAPLFAGPAIELLARRIAAGSMSDYAAQYVEAARNDPEAFRRGVRAVEKLDAGVTYSIGDENALVASVLRALGSV